MTNHPLIIAAICIAGTALASVNGQPPAAPSRAEQREQMVQRALDAQTPLKAGAAYKELFQKFGDDLDQLAMDSRLGVALNAGWESALRLAAKKQVDPQRFLGFFEGVMRAKLPDRWEVYMILKLAEKDRELRGRYLEIHGESPSIRRLTPKGDFVFMPPQLHETGLGCGTTNLQFRLDDNRPEIQIGERSITVTPKLASAITRAVKEKGGQTGQTTVEDNDRFIAISLFDKSGVGGDLLVFDQENSDISWSVKLWGHIARELSQGPRIKLGLIFLGGIERNKGCANDAVEIAPVTEETHVTRVIAYPASHQRILRPLA